MLSNWFRLAIQLLTSTRWSLCHTCANRSRMDNVSRARAHNRKHRHEARSFISHTFIYAMQRHVWCKYMNASGVCWQWKKKRARRIRISQFDECESSTKWTMNKNRICHFFSSLFISSRPTDVCCVICSVLCADIGIISSKNEMKRMDEQKTPPSRIKSPANCTHRFSKERICKEGWSGVNSSVVGGVGGNVCAFIRLPYVRSSALVFLSCFLFASSSDFRPFRNVKNWTRMIEGQVFEFFITVLSVIVVQLANNWNAYFFLVFV